MDFFVVATKYRSNRKWIFSFPLVNFDCKWKKLFFTEMFNSAFEFAANFVPYTNFSEALVSPRKSERKLKLRITYEKFKVLRS